MFRQIPLEGAANSSSTRVRLQIVQRGFQLRVDNTRDAAETSQYEGAGRVLESLTPGACQRAENQLGAAVNDSSGQSRR